RLIHRPSIRRPDTWNNPQLDIQSSEPGKHLFVFGQREVINKRVAAINQTRDAAALNVSDDSIILLKVERPNRVLTSCQRWHGEHSAEIFDRYQVSFHGARVRSPTVREGRSPQHQPQMNTDFHR